MRLAFWRRAREEEQPKTLDDAMWQTVEASIRNQRDLWQLTDGGHWLVNKTANFALWVASKDYGMRGWAIEPGAKHLIEQYDKMPKTPSNWASKIWAGCRSIIETAETECDLEKYSAVLIGFERTLTPLQLVVNNDKKERGT